MLAELEGFCDPLCRWEAWATTAGFRAALEPCTEANAPANTRAGCRHRVICHRAERYNQRVVERPEGLRGEPPQPLLPQRIPTERIRFQQARRESRGFSPANQ